MEQSLLFPCFAFFFVKFSKESRMVRITDQFKSCVLFGCFCFCCDKFEFFNLRLWNVMWSLCRNRFKFFRFEWLNFGLNYRRRLTVGISRVSSNISQLKTLRVNHCLKFIKGPLPAWFTNQQSGALDQNYPKKRI